MDSWEATRWRRQWAGLRGHLCDSGRALRSEGPKVRQLCLQPLHLLEQTIPRVTAVWSLVTDATRAVRVICYVYGHHARGHGFVEGYDGKSVPGSLDSPSLRRTLDGFVDPNLKLFSEAMDKAIQQASAASLAVRPNE